MMTHEMSRRMFLAAGALAGAGCAAPRGTTSVRRGPFATYSELLGAVPNPRVLGHAPDGSPVIAARAGGDKKPAIFISAGSHATEHAGVVAAVELINELDTGHQVFVLPCRDPIGLSGFNYALSLGLGENPGLNSLAQVEPLLRRKGEILYEKDGTVLALIGNIGYSTRGLYRKIEKGAKALEPLKGRRIYFPSRHDDRPAAGPLERAYSLIVTPDGEVLHVNRFHDTAWAPAEVRATRRLMAEINPGLTFDLHEYGGDHYWMSARTQRTAEDDAWERRMAAAAAKAAAAAGATFPPADYRPGAFFDVLEPGVFILNPEKRGEGLNLADFASRRYGPSFTIETGLRMPFGDRVTYQKAVVKAAVKMFEGRYRR